MVRAAGCAEQPSECLDGCGTTPKPLIILEQLQSIHSFAQRFEYDY
jgi:hypothetical protein